MTVEYLQALLTVKEVAEMHDVPARVVRKAAKSGTIPGHIEVLGKSGFDPAQVVDWTPPEPCSRVVGAKRPDGRQRYRLYANPEERDKLLAEGYEITDPRQAAKERRAAKKAKAEGDEVSEASEGEGSNEDLFADFDV